MYSLLTLIPEKKLIFSSLDEELDDGLLDEDGFEDEFEGFELFDEGLLDEGLLDEDELEGFEELEDGFEDELDDGLLDEDEL